MRYLCLCIRREIEREIDKEVYRDWYLVNKSWFPVGVGSSIRGPRYRTPKCFGLLLHQGFSLFCNGKWEGWGSVVLWGESPPSVVGLTGFFCSEDSTVVKVKR